MRNCTAYNLVGVLQRARTRREAHRHEAGYVQRKFLPVRDVYPEILKVELLIKCASCFILMEAQSESKLRDW